MESHKMETIAQRILLGVICSAAVLTSSCSSETQSKNINDKDSTSAVPVEVSAVANADISAYYTSTATLEAKEEAMVVAKVRGIVREMYVEEGDEVQTGDVLAQLEDKQLELEARRARATMERLKNELERKQELYQKKLISAQEFENAKYEFEAEQSAYELAQLKVDHSRIKAPINGIISERLIKTGNMIDADQEVFEVTDFSLLLAVVNVPEHEMNKLRKGQSALIQTDAIPGEIFEGTILRINPTVNPETGTFKVTVSVNDDSQKLKPGMFGRIQIIYDTHPDALQIPKNAIITEDGESRVYVIKERIAYRRSVKTGYANGNNVEVLEGLTPSDTVVVTGQSSLQDSTLIEVVTL